MGDGILVQFWQSFLYVFYGPYKDVVPILNHLIRLFHFLNIFGKSELKIQNQLHGNNDQNRIFCIIDEQKPCFEVGFRALKVLNFSGQNDKARLHPVRILYCPIWPIIYMRVKCTVYRVVHLICHIYLLYTSTI